MFLVCGEALFDFFLESEDGPGAATYDARAGGSPFNVAIGLARLGQDVAMMTGLSSDLLGQRLETVLRNENVSTDFVVRTDRPTTLSLVGLDTEGVPAYQFFDRDSANTGLTKADLPPLTSQISGLHFGSFSIASAPIADALAALAEDHRDLFIALDPNIRPTVEPDMGLWRRRLAVLYGCANLVKISAEDLELVYPDMSADAFAAMLLERGVGLVVVTDGGGEARGWAPGGISAVAAPPVTNVVDTVGAGDTFQAALIASLLRRNDDPIKSLLNLSASDLATILDYAARAAAITCSRRGADMPRATELTE